MVCMGSKTLQRKVCRHSNLSEENYFPGEENLMKLDTTRTMKKKIGTRKENSSLIVSGQTTGGTSDSSRQDGKKMNKRNLKHEKWQVGSRKNIGHSGNLSKDHRSTSQLSLLRKKVDPEMAKYFLEISNLFEGNEVDLEERPFICANALGETRGKELELATDMIISHTLQTLLEGCDLNHLSSFLQSCAKDFSLIAIDKNGSHVAETALRCLGVHLQDQESFDIIENILTRICEAVVVEPVTVMCSSYGSHVIRSLLCLCKGLPLDSLEEFHVTKVSAVLAERLNIKSPKSSHSNPSRSQQGFPHLLKFLSAELLKNAGAEITTLRVNKYSSFVLQTALKLLVGDDKELLHFILTILGCSEENISLEVFVKSANMHEMMDLLKDTASSHLIEVILEVAPDVLYHELFENLFKGSLVEISSHQCGNFAVQALISSARCKYQVDSIWEELRLNIRELLAIGKSGVVASLLAACQRYQIHDHECCETLVSALCPKMECARSIVPYLLFLDNFLSCKNVPLWKWPTGNKMHVLGCLMLQTVFSYLKQFIKPYIESMVCIETDYLLEIAKDSGGSRVLESFLCSDASAKEKIEVISKFQSQFGDLSLHRSGSFIVEKCFAASNLSLKEVIVSELASIKDALSKTKHGPYILKKLDVDRYVMQPKHWRSSQSAKEAVYKEFQVTFGSTNNTKHGSAVAEPKPKRRKEDKKLKKATSLVDTFMENTGFSTPSAPDFPGYDKAIDELGSFGSKSKRTHGANGPEDVGKRPGKKFLGNSFLRRSSKRKCSSSDSADLKQPVKKKFSYELADLAAKGSLSAGEFRKLLRNSADHVKQSAIPRKTNFVRQRR